MVAALSIILDCGSLPHVPKFQLSHSALGNRKEDAQGKRVLRVKLVFLKMLPRKLQSTTFLVSQ